MDISKFYSPGSFPRLDHNQTPSPNPPIIVNLEVPMIKNDLVIKDWNLSGMWDLDIGI